MMSRDIYRYRTKQKKQKGKEKKKISSYSNLRVFHLLFQMKNHISEIEIKHFILIKKIEDNDIKYTLLISFIQWQKREEQKRCLSHKGRN